MRQFPLELAARLKLYVQHNYRREARQMNSELLESQLPRGYDASASTLAEFPARLELPGSTFAIAGGTGR